MDMVAEQIAEIKLQEASSRIIVFCEFQFVKDQLRKILPQDSYVDGFAYTIWVGEEFKISTKYVLFLQMDAPVGDRWCLDVANHVMFVGAYSTTRPYNFQSIMALAVERDMRRQQIKSVYIWNYLWEWSIYVREKRNGNKALRKFQDENVVLLALERFEGTEDEKERKVREKEKQREEKEKEEAKREAEIAIRTAQDLIGVDDEDAYIRSILAETKSEVAIGTSQDLITSIEDDRDSFLESLLSRRDYW